MSDMIERVARALEPKCQAFGKGDMPMQVAREFARAAVEAMREPTDEIERLRGAIKAYLDGDYPNPREHRPGKCEHGTYYWEECSQCIDAHFIAALSPPPPTEETKS